MNSANSPVSAAHGPGRSDERRLLVGTLLTLLVVAAWAVLGLWSASPYGRYLDHGGWGDAAASRRYVARSPRATSWCPRCCTPGPGC